MPFGNLPLSAFAVGPRASAMYNPNEQALLPQVPRGMMFSGFGGQAPARASDAFGFGPKPNYGTPPYYPGAPVGPDTPAPMMGSYNPAATQTPTAGAPGGYVDPSAVQQRPATWAKGGAGWDAVSNIGNTLMALSGDPTLAALAQQNRSQRFQREQQQQAQWAQASQLEREDAQRQQDRLWQVEDRDFKASQPEYFMSGNDRVRLDPATGEARVVYDGRSDAEEYARALGIDPASPEYRTALQDYVLRGNGPTAFNYDQKLEGVRQGNRLSLRQTPTYAQAHPRPVAPRAPGGGASRAPTTLAGAVAPILAKMASGQPLTQAEQSAWNTYQGARSGRGRAAGGSAPAPAPAAAPKRARGPDGRIYEARGGQWVPVK